MRRAVPLAAFWFLYFGGLGIFYPYFALYLQENAGLSGAQVGVVLAVLPLVGMLAQPVWGHVADRTGARSGALTLLALGAGGGYLLLGAAHGFWPIVVATGALSAFASAVVPMALSVTFAAMERAGPHAFGLVRVWGTLGYLACVAGFPRALRRFHAVADAAAVEPGLEWMFIAAAALTGAAVLIGPALPRGGSVALRARRGDWRLLIREAAVVRFLLFMLGGYLFLQGPSVLFPIYIRALGGDLETIGRMWVVMLVIEIPLVALSGAGLRRFGARGLLAVGVLAGGVRWTISGLVSNLPTVYVVQILHGVTVAGLLLGGPLYLEQVVPGRLRSTAQGLLAMVGVGIGGIVSSLASGWLLEQFGPHAPFLIGGLGALALGCGVKWVLPIPRSPAGT